MHRIAMSEDTALLSGAGATLLEKRQRYEAVLTQLYGSDTNELHRPFAPQYETVCFKNAGNGDAQQGGGICGVLGLSALTAGLGLVAQFECQMKTAAYVAYGVAASPFAIAACIGGIEATNCGVHACQSAVADRRISKFDRQEAEAFDILKEAGVTVSEVEWRYAKSMQQKFGLFPAPLDEKGDASEPVPTQVRMIIQ